MRKIRLLCAATFSLILFINSRCKKSDAEPQLPPETTTGAGTFGCKVDGKVFLPRGGSGSPGLRVEYINYGNGDWRLNVAAIDWESKRSVSIETDSLLLEEGITYELKASKGFAKGQYVDKLIAYGIRIGDTGTLKVTRHDLNERILSGIFWFNVTSDNSKANVTEGRFDVRY